MDKIKEDVLRTIDVVNGRSSANYSSVYAKSNENLHKLFSRFSIKDKKVLTVLSSSDQYFLFCYLGAASVDTFDKNRLTEYYYYIRKWLLEYKNTFYPNEHEIKLSNQWIYDLLKKVECNSYCEKKAYEYWYSYIMSCFGFLGKNLFKVNGKCNRVGINDLDKLRECLLHYEFSFTTQDVCGDVKNDKKYDVIFLSNILEYYMLDSTNLLKCRDNLYDILEDGGKIICSCLDNFSVDKKELTIFRKKFDFIRYPYIDTKYYKSSASVGYCYQKLK